REYDSMRIITMMLSRWARASGESTTTATGEQSEGDRRADCEDAPMGVGCSAASTGLSVLHGLIGRLQTTPGLWSIGYTPVPHGHIVIPLQTTPGLWSVCNTPPISRHEPSGLPYHAASAFPIDPWRMTNSLVESRGVVQSGKTANRRLSFPMMYRIW